MEIKIKHILFVAFALTIGIVSFVIIKMKVVKNENCESIDVNAEETTYSEYVYYGPDSYTSWELGYEVAKKDGNWSRLPLSSEFRKKYNERDGILGNLEFDKIELAPYDNITEYSDKYYFVNRNCYFVISRGKEKIAYIYNLKYDGNLLSDVLIKDVCNLSNEYGEELNVSGYAITNNNFKDSMDFLARGGNDEKSVAVTDSFHTKYPFFLDIFEHYSPLRFNPIEFVPERSSWDRKEAYFIVDSKLECKKRHYKVKFTLDDKGYLDDVKVNNVNEEEYNNNEKDGGLHIFYINSNWNGLNLTENFRKKFNSSEGIFPEIKLLGNNFDFGQETEEYKQVSIGGDAKVNQIRGFKINGMYKYYLYKVYKDEKGNIDDIVYDKLPYDNIPLEEVKELYLKKHNIQ